MSKIKSITPLIIILFLTSCESRQTMSDANDKPSEPVEKRGVELNLSQLEYAGIEYGSIQNQRLSSDVQARGELVLPVNAKVDMVSLYSGIIKIVHVNEGDPVSKGQVLATINSGDFIEAQQKYLMVKNEIGMLKQEYERQKELNKEKISSDKYYQKSQADYNVAMAELKGLKLQLEMAGVNEALLAQGKIITEHKIISPINGFIENIDVNPGKYVNPDESLFQVLNRDNLLVEINVFEKDILKVAIGQRVTFSLSSMNSKVHEASVISVGNTVQQEGRVIKVLAEFSNKGGRLLPGMFVAGEIHTGEKEVTALPEEAVLRVGNEGYMIFYTSPEMQHNNNTQFDYVPVQIGNAEDGFIQIELLKPIPENAMIVTKGGYYLKTELAKQEE